MKEPKGNKKIVDLSVNEPAVEYIRKGQTRRPGVKQLLVTPKSRKSLGHLKKLLNQMDGVEDVEVIENDEVVDDELLKKILKGMKSGLTTEAKVMESLNRIIHGK